MTPEFTEGEEIVVPCKHCSSVSLTLSMKVGSAIFTCHKCGKDTRLSIEKDGTGWSIRSESHDPAAETP